MAKKNTKVKTEIRKKRKTAPVTSAKKSAGNEAAASAGGRNPFFVAGIGASAGGLEAFEQFFTSMPPDSGIAFVLIPHLSPSHKSIMRDLLKRHTAMEIFEAEDGMKVSPNCVYLITPNRDMTISGGVLRLTEHEESRGLRHPIDLFFRSLADDLRERAIGIVLSGTGTEGALGLRAIKGAGGLVLAQDPETAKYNGMPESSIRTGLVDFILPPEKMPEQLIRYVKRDHTIKMPVQTKPPVRSAAPLQTIFSIIRSHTGHDFSLYKQSTILRRIEKRMAFLQIDSFADYALFLRSHPEEIAQLFRELLIRVTNFFRDPEAFEVIRKEVLPLICRDKTYENSLRIWVPGCATGEEAYSLAMIVREHMQEINADFKVQIFATDIDVDAINTARAGIYPNNIAVDVSPDRLQHFFTRTDARFKVRKEIRDMVVFAAHDIIKDPPFMRLDLISCRNLLIYLGPDLQEKLFPSFNYALNPAGILFLGTSETIGGHADLFTVLDRKWKTFAAKRSGIYSARAYLRPSVSSTPYLKADKIPEKRSSGNAGIGGLTDQFLLEHYCPPAVIVNQKGDILYIHGRTGKYLEPSSGRASMNILEMAREGLRSDLRNALRNAAGEKRVVTLDGLNVKTNGSHQIVNAEVRHIEKPEPLKGMIIVTFREVAAPKETKGAGADARVGKKIDRRVTDLEFELKTTRQNLQTTIEELEAANEELKSMNEELQSSNEELQSTNEELETSQEELQSVNEELMTVNTELQQKIDELSKVSSDMNNLMASSQIATIFLDRDLKIKRFTPASTAMINLRPSDTGRPVSDISSKLDYPGLLKDVEDVIRDLAPVEKVVRDLNGRWILSRILPYRTVEDVIDGAVITFIDITPQKRAEEALQDALVFTKGILQTVREPLLVLDADLRIISATQSYYRFFGVSQQETEKRLIYEIAEGRWNIPELRHLLENILPDNSQFNDYPVEGEFPGIGRKKLLLNARRIYQKERATETILLAFEEVADRDR